VRVRVHDFLDDTLGKVIPYGVYDVGRNTGWVSVGGDHDTPAFAVESIARWWRYMAKKMYPNARELLITADAGGSNGARARLWKVELQRFADRTAALLPHYRELAWPPVDRSRDGGAVHWGASARRRDGQSRLSSTRVRIPLA
jgi:hypothetical protein